MKKASLLVLLIVFLTGCNGPDAELDRAMSLRSNVLQAQQCSFETQITADYGDKLHQFSVSCQGNAQGDLSFRILEPDTISGISGKISDIGGKITFDDTALHFDLLADEQITPVSAPWIFLKTLRSGNIIAVGQDADHLRLSIDETYEEESLRLDIWLDSADIPCRAEILYAGRRILSLDVNNFDIQ